KSRTILAIILTLSGLCKTWFFLPLLGRRTGESSVPWPAGERRGQLELLGTVVQRQRKMLQKISAQQTIHGACPREGSQDTYLQILDDGLPHGQSGDWHEWELHLLPSDHFEQTQRPVVCRMQPSTPGRLGRQHGVGSTCVEEERDWLCVIEHGLDQHMVVDHLNWHRAQHAGRGRGGGVGGGV